MKILKRIGNLLMAVMLVLVSVLSVYESIAYADVSSEYDNNVKEEYVSDSLNITIDGNSIKNTDDKDEEKRIKLNIYESERELHKKLQVSIDTEPHKKVTYRYEADNVNITSIDATSLEVGADPSVSGFGYINIYAEFESGETEHKSVYTYAKNNKVYISESSKDAALYDYLEESYNTGRLTKEIAISCNLLCSISALAA